MEAIDYLLVMVAIAVIMAGLGVVRRDRALDELKEMKDGDTLKAYLLVLRRAQDGSGMIRAGLICLFIAASFLQLLSALKDAL